MARFDAPQLHRCEDRVEEILDFGVIFTAYVEDVRVFVAAIVFGPFRVSVPVSGAKTEPNKAPGRVLTLGDDLGVGAGDHRPNPRPRFCSSFCSCSISTACC